MDNKTVDIYLSRLCDANNKLLIIKHGNIIILNIPNEYMIFFDIYDVFNTFDNTIVIPENLFRIDSVKLFIKLLPLIIAKEYDILFEFLCHHKKTSEIITGEELVDIIALCDFLQYNKESFQKMCYALSHIMHINDVLIINNMLLTKINIAPLIIDPEEIMFISTTDAMFKKIITLLESNKLKIDFNIQDKLYFFCHMHFKKSEHYNDFLKIIKKDSS